MASETDDAGGFSFFTPGTTVSDATTPSGNDAFGAIDPAVTGNGSGDFDAGDDGFDPAIHVGRDKRNADGSYRRKRGKRAGGGGGKTSARSSGKASVTTIETALVGIHAMVAAFVQAPELELERDESEPYAKAVAEVAKYYDIPQIADKTLAWVGLIFVMGKIYGPRAVLITERMKAEKAQNVTPEDGTVLHFRPNPAG